MNIDFIEVKYCTKHECDINAPFRRTFQTALKSFCISTLHQYRKIIPVYNKE